MFAVSIKFCFFKYNSYNSLYIKIYFRIQFWRILRQWRMLFHFIFYFIINVVTNISTRFWRRSKLFCINKYCCVSTETRFSRGLAMFVIVCCVHLSLRSHDDKCASNFDDTSKSGMVVKTCCPREKKIFTLLSNIASHYCRVTQCHYTFYRCSVKIIAKWYDFLRKIRVASLNYIY